MSEQIGVTISIGGELPASLIEELFDTLQENLDELNEGPTHEASLREGLKNLKSYVTWGGTANYGNCNDIMTFCMKHGLSFLYHCEGKFEYSAEIQYWIPGMETEITISSDQNGTEMMRIDEARPLMDLLFNIAKDGEKALPAFLGHEGLEDLVETGLKNYSAFFPKLHNQINKLLPQVPTLPPLTIKESDYVSPPEPWPSPESD